MIQDEINKFLYKLYNDVSTTSVSLQNRQKLGLDNDKNYVYGDTHLVSIPKILAQVSPKPGEIFYDLGSGGGRMVLATALNFSFGKCIGIELLQDLHNLAQTKLKQLQETIDLFPFTEKPLVAPVEFIHDNFTHSDISNADIVYIHATCFADDVLINLIKHLETQLKSGSRVIIITKSLASKKFKLLCQEMVAMEWGQATTFYYEKI